jgi:hypothetical protein
MISEREKEDVEFLMYNWIFHAKTHESFRVSEIISYLKEKDVNADVSDVKDILRHWSDSGLIYSNMNGYHIALNAIPA